MAVDNKGFAYLLDYDDMIYGLSPDFGEIYRFHLESEVSDSKSASYNSVDIHNRSATIFGYSNSPSRSVSANFIIVAKENAKKEVWDRVMYLRSFVYPDYTTGAPFSRPPHRVYFSYGDSVEIIGIMTDCSVTWGHEIMFEGEGKSGHLLKATVSITIQEVREDKPLDFSEVRTKGEGWW